MVAGGRRGDRRVGPVGDPGYPPDVPLVCRITRARGGAGRCRSGHETQQGAHEWTLLEHSALAHWREHPRWAD